MLDIMTMNVSFFLWVPFIYIQYPSLIFKLFLKREGEKKKLSFRCPDSKILVVMRDPSASVKICRHYSFMSCWFGFWWFLMLTSAALILSVLNCSLNHFGADSWRTVVLQYAAIFPTLHVLITGLVALVRCSIFWSHICYYIYVSQHWKKKKSNLKADEALPS